VQITSFEKRLQESHRNIYDYFLSERRYVVSGSGFEAGSRIATTSFFHFDIGKSTLKS